ncbi:MAG: hypothetical protein M3428_06680 [Pseudomonadota bacterium]|jgi:hypothetical protein|nr:hypothetical protein [Sphingomonas sp.]MDQ3472043.1 hypothetical protein [Pseudomonadota bacterium]
MRTQLTLAMAPLLALAACGSDPQPREADPKIAVRSAEQDRLHQLAEPDREIALKRAILAAGYPCKRLEKAGFVAKHENLDMWMATCSEGRDWAVFAGPDGSAQIRDCVDVPRFGLPECKVSKQPARAPSG